MLDVQANNILDEHDALFFIDHGTITHGVWMDELGGILAVTGAGTLYNGQAAVGDVVIIKPDGKLFRYGQAGRAWSGVGWAYDDVPVLRGSSPNGLAKVLVPPLKEYSPNTNLTDTNFALLADRLIYFDGDDVQTRPLGGGGPSLEAVIDTGNAGPGRIFPYDLTADNELYWLCDIASGKLYLYDAVAKAKVSGYDTGFGQACRMPCYSRKHNVFGCLVDQVVGEDTFSSLWIFANEPAAASISTPTFNPATPIAGTPATLSATVTGSLGEPCPGRAVTFGVAVGVLLAATVLTDANGVATTTYRAPYTSSSGNAVTATLVE